MQTWIYAQKHLNTVIGISYEGLINIWPFAVEETHATIEGFIDIKPAMVLPIESFEFNHTIQKVIPFETKWLLLSINQIYIMQIQNNKVEIEEYFPAKCITDIDYHKGKLYACLYSGEVVEYDGKVITGSMDNLSIKAIRIAVSGNDILVGSNNGEVLHINWTNKSIQSYIYTIYGQFSDKRLPIKQLDTISMIKIESSWAVN